MKEIKLTQGKVALVDDDDYEELNKHKWYAFKAYNVWYAKRTAKNIMMHRVILNAQKGQVTDHADHDGLNNQRYNIRLCTDKQNIWNKRASKNGVSKYKGVWFCKQTEKWKVQICCNGKKIHLGRYIYEKDAAFAYNLKAMDLFGEYATLNNIYKFPETVRYPFNPFTVR